MSSKTSTDFVEQEREDDAADAIDMPAVPSSLGATTMFIKENLPHLGLLEGDELLQINGSPANDVNTCRVVLKSAMTLSLEFRRPGELGLVRRLAEPSITGISS